MNTLPKQVQDQAEYVAQFDAQVTAPALEHQAEPAAPAVEPVAPPPAPAAAAPPPEAYWEQRFRTLQGVMDAQTREFRTKIEGLQAEIAQKAKQPEPTPAPKPSSITSQDEQAFGADLLDVIKRQAADIARDLTAPMQAEIKSLTDRNQQLEKQLGGVAERQGNENRQRYFADLRVMVPNYEAINANPAFVAWCVEKDPVAGVPRQTFLDSAFDGFDVPRTALFFQRWIAEHPAPSPTPPTPAPSPSPTTSRAETPAATAPTGRTWSRGEIERFFAARGRGEYRGREAEADAIEAEIDLAVQNNRVTA